MSYRFVDSFQQDQESIAGSKDVAPRFLNIDTRFVRLVRYVPQPFYSEEEPMEPNE